MTKTKMFDAFGVQYRVTQFSAVTCMTMLGKDISPLEELSGTEVKGPMEWVRLDNREAINEYVVDKANILPPVLVLRGLVRLVHDFSFAFTKDWKGVKIPVRLQGDGEIKNSTHVQPMMAQIMTEKMATLRELEEYYSLEDAFKMFDVIVAKSINTALAHEAAGKR
jgi:hypothetical protein